MTGSASIGTPGRPEKRVTARLEAVPEQVHGARLAVEPAAELLEHRVRPVEDPAEARDRVAIPGRVVAIVRERRRHRHAERLLIEELTVWSVQFRLRGCSRRPTRPAGHPPVGDRCARVGDRDHRASGSRLTLDPVRRRRAGAARIRVVVVTSVVGSVSTTGSLAVAGSAATAGSVAVAGSAATAGSVAVAGSAATAGSVAVAGSVATVASAGVALSSLTVLGAGIWMCAATLACVGCTRCVACVGCVDCVDCVGCVGCVGLRGAHRQVGAPRVHSAAHGSPW